MKTQIHSIQFIHAAASESRKSTGSTHLHTRFGRVCSQAPACAIKKKKKVDNSQKRTIEDTKACKPL